MELLKRDSNSNDKATNIETWRFVCHMGLYIVYVLKVIVYVLKLEKNMKLG